MICLSLVWHAVVVTASTSLYAQESRELIKPDLEMYLPRSFEKMVYQVSHLLLRCGIRGVSISLLSLA